ncbi:MAG: carbohydrate-binding protein [Chitinispirillales bacterium]|jgi:hypothetical protein|nr:carbohydrate-binding protein [Chitinispirillales bacterium]
MKKAFSTVTRFTILFIVILAAGVSAEWLSRYWDGCKPTCSWAQNIPKNSEYGLCKSCDVNNEELFLGDIAEAKSSCGGGPAYTCWDQIPFVDPKNKIIAYGFGATSNIACGECFEVTFTGGYENGTPMPMHTALASSSSGKKLILMGRNTGSDVAPNQIDFLVPGGGVGMFDSFSEQLGFPNTYHPAIGRPSGGFLADCIDKMIQQFGGNWNAPGILEAAQACVREGCNSVFNTPERAQLLQGCLFYADWMMAAPNPQATFKKLDKCPQILVDKYKPKSSEYTIMLKAMYYTSKEGSADLNDGNLTLSQIRTGTTLTYNITAPHTGEYTLSFSVNTGEKTTISVKVNDQPAVSTDEFTTQNWQDYETVTLNSKVNLVKGSNTIVLSFKTNSVNFDYFILVGEEQGQSPVKFNSAKTNKTRSNVALRPVNKGFTAILPKGHSYHSYSLINLQGREIRSGAVKAGAAELHFNNINKGVLFLRLKGKNNITTVLKTTTF